MADTVDTDSLINQAIEARAQREAQRQNIDAQRQRLAQQLGSTNPRNRAQVHQIRAQLSNLDAVGRGINAEQRAEDMTTNLRVNSSFRNAHLSTKALDNQRHDQTAQQVTNLMNGLAKLEAKYPNRGFDANQSEKFHSELAQLRNENTMGMRNESTAARMWQAAQFHDQERQKTLNEAAKSLSKITQGLTPEQFASRDHAKDFSTNAGSLKEATSADQKVNQRISGGANTVFEAGGNRYMMPTTAFNHYDSNFKLQPQAESAPVQPTIIPPEVQTPQQYVQYAKSKGLPYTEGNVYNAPAQTPEQQAASEGYRDLNQFKTFQETGKVISPTGAVGEPAVQARQASIQDTLEQGRAVVGNRPAASQPGALVQPYQLEQPTATPPTVVQPQGQPNMLAAPTNPTERVAGQLYTSPNGKIGRWTGSEWIEQ